MKNSSKFIQFAVQQGVLQFGEFTLKSGRVSPYFFNAGLFNDGAALDKLSSFYAQAIVDSKIEFDMLFGPAYKGIPLVAAIAMTLYRDYGLNYPYAFNRKEVKKHGDGGQLVGATLKGKVLVIDDVITAGTAINEAAEIIASTASLVDGKMSDEVNEKSSSGAQLAAVAIAFDRQEVAKDSTLSAVEQVEQRLNASVISVATAGELINYAEANDMYTKHLKNLKKYLVNFQSNTI